MSTVDLVSAGVKGQAMAGGFYVYTQTASAAAGHQVAAWQVRVSRLFIGAVI